MKVKFLRIATMAALLLAAITMGHAQNVPITVHEGWNWISYPKSEPMSVAEAFSGFTPSQGDMIKSESDGYALYRNGNWLGSLTTLYPGRGYHYQSVDGTTKSFIFGGTANDPSALPEAALDGEFTVDANGTKVRFSPGNLQCRINPTQETQALVGTGKTGYSTMPYNTLYYNSLCQMIYKAEELHEAGLMAGPITGIAFESYSTNHYLRDNVEIWIDATTLTTAPSTSVSTSGMKKVFFGSVTQQTGWTEIAFTSSPFIWDGTSNLMVTVVMNHGRYNSATYWRCSSLGFTCCNYTCNDGNAYDPSSSTYSMITKSYRPNTRFNGKGGATWRFAEQQWDYIGDGNANVSGSYTGWIDLFGWGTSGHPHGAVYYQPWSTGTGSSNYYAYGGESYNLFDQTGEADWGCNAISNGGGKPNQWRTLTHEEWDYMLNTRSGKRYAKARVAGVNGLIVLPDGWKTSYYSLSNTNTANAAFSSNVITAYQWTTLEQHGAVFLPKAGLRSENTVLNYSGVYQTSSIVANDELDFISPCWISFGDNNLSTLQYAIIRDAGASVRLVCQSNPRIRTLGVSNVTTTGATVSAEADFTGTVGARGICWNTTAAPTYDDNHAAAGSGKGGFSAQLTGLQPNTTYHVRAYAKISSVYRYGNELTFTTADDGCNGHAYVDLGLPSGTLWATCNVGANTPEEYGDYFAWGETQTKGTYDLSTYKYANGTSLEDPQLTKYCTSSVYGYNGYVDNLTILLPEDDAAMANWGGDWRMPTVDDLIELYVNTTFTWTTQNGVNGMLFTASNGNSLFLPAAGCRTDSSLEYAGSICTILSSWLYPDAYTPIYSCGFFFISGSDEDGFIIPRGYGFSVRPVCSSRQN